MRINLKTKIADWLRKCAYRLDHKAANNFPYQLPAVTPYICDCQVGHVDTLSAMIKYRLHLGESLQQAEKQYIYPELSKLIVERLMKSGYMTIIRSCEGVDWSWVAELNVVKMNKD